MITPVGRRKNKSIPKYTLGPKLTNLRYAIGTNTHVNTISLYYADDHNGFPSLTVDLDHLSRDMANKTFGTIGDGTERYATVILSSKAEDDPDAEKYNMRSGETFEEYIARVNFTKVTDDVWLKARDNGKSDLMLLKLSEDKRVSNGTIRSFRLKQPLSNIQLPNTGWVWGYASNENKGKVKRINVNDVGLCTVNIFSNYFKVAEYEETRKLDLRWVYASGDVTPCTVTHYIYGFHPENGGSVPVFLNASNVAIFEK